MRVPLVLGFAGLLLAASCGKDWAWPTSSKTVYTDSNNNTVTVINLGGPQDAHIALSVDYADGVVKTSWEPMGDLANAPGLVYELWANAQVVVSSMTRKAWWTPLPGQYVVKVCLAGQAVICSNEVEVTIDPPPEEAP